MKVNIKFAWGSQIFVAVLALSLLLPFGAAANDLPNADQTGTVVVSGPDIAVDLCAGAGNPLACCTGPGVGNCPAFTVTKTVEVFNPGNLSNPCTNTSQFCYVYNLANDAMSPVGVEGFSIQLTNACTASAAGALPGGGVGPTGTTISPVEVRWEFFGNDACTAPATPVACCTGPGAGTCNKIIPGLTSDHLTLSSTCGPAANPAGVNGEFALDAPTMCLGPGVPPTTEANPISCTIGFWKNRSEAKQGLLKFFPGTINLSTGACGSPTEDLCQVITRAVVIASPVFGTAANDAAVTNAMRLSLLNSLTSKGSRPPADRAKQQIAAVTLSLASGSLFPSNTRCAFFCGNTISATTYPDVPLNADPSGDPTKLTICDALAYIKSILGTNPNRALEIADDLNNGIGVNNVTVN